VGTESVASLGSFIERVQEIRDAWAVPDYKELWFRGEKRDYGDSRLRPALYRPPKDRSRRLKPVTELLEIERDLFERFLNSSEQLVERPPEDEFDGYILMQHHDAPTRLLDWSDGSLMALHFALRGKLGDPRDPVVYMLEPERLIDTLEALPDWHPNEEWPVDDESIAYLPNKPEDLELPRVPMLLTFRQMSRRVAAQHSQLLVFGTDPAWLSKQLSEADPPIEAITIDGQKTREMRAQLRECGVSESVIFPDLDGLGRELRQLWQDRQ
jgi:hypothetical protein